MNNMKKFASLLLALVMLLAMAAPAMAAAGGSITINSSENVKVEGKTFNAYKILDLEMVGATGYVYTVPANLKSFYAKEFNLDQNSGDFDYEVAQKIGAMEDNSAELFAFTAKALQAAKDAGIVPGTATGAEGAESVTIEKLEMGYYVIEDVGAALPISALMLKSNNAAAEVTLKADKPSIEKKIDGDSDTDGTTKGKVDYNNAAIGDKVPYVLTSKVPDMTGYTKYFYVVTDKLSAGLTFNNDIAIKVGEKSLEKDTDYTVEVTVNDDGTTTVKIVFVNFIQYLNQKGADITITYSANIDADAVIGNVGNPNEVKLIYSNNPNIVPGGENEPNEDDPTGETPVDKTYTYVTEIEIEKVDGNGDPLTGAQFELVGEKTNIVLIEKQEFVEDAAGTHWKLKNGTYTTTDPSTEGIAQDTYESTTTKYALKETTETVETKEAVKATAYVGADGKLVFSGLSAGDYTITELVAPNGYNLLAKPIKVTIGWTAPAEGSTECVWSYVWENINDTDNSIKVVNEAGDVLPETGGMGTTAIYAMGSLLIVGAALALLMKKRVAA